MLEREFNNLLALGTDRRLDDVSTKPPRPESCWVPVLVQEIGLTGPQLSPALSWGVKQCLIESRAIP